MGSDYYATNEEDPLVGSNSFKKKSKIGQKRKRDDDDSEDIIAILEGQSSNQLATKS